jgi:single-stranded-DNA-specific exonuclease
VAAERLVEFAEFLNERLASAAGGPVVPLLEIDGAIAGAAVTPELVQMVGRLAPYGSGNPEPRFAVTDLRVVRSETAGEGHVRLLLAGPDGTRLKAIAFRSADGPLGQALLRGAGAPLHLAGNLRSDNWQDREGVQLIVDDGAPAQA